MTSGTRARMLIALLVTQTLLLAFVLRELRAARRRATVTPAEPHLGDDLLGDDEPRSDTLQRVVKEWRVKSQASGEMQLVAIGDPTRKHEVRPTSNKLFLHLVPTTIIEGPSALFPKVDCQLIFAVTGFGVGVVESGSHSPLCDNSVFVIDGPRLQPLDIQHVSVLRENQYTACVNLILKVRAEPRDKTGYSGRAPEGPRGGVGLGYLHHVGPSDEPGEVKPGGHACVCTIGLPTELFDRILVAARAPNPTMLLLHGNVAGLTACDEYLHNEYGYQSARDLLLLPDQLLTLDIDQLQVVTQVHQAPPLLADKNPGTSSKPS